MKITVLFIYFFIYQKALTFNIFPLFCSCFLKNIKCFHRVEQTKLYKKTLCWKFFLIILKSRRQLFRLFEYSLSEKLIFHWEYNSQWSDFPSQIANIVFTIWTENEYRFMRKIFKEYSLIYCVAEDTISKSRYNWQILFNIVTYECVKNQKPQSLTNELFNFVSNIYKLSQSDFVPNFRLEW